MEKGYWQGLLEERLGRRRLIAATGATALGGAFLAACGDDDDSGDATGATEESPCATG